MFRRDSAILFYLFHILYLGRPSVMLGRLWMTWQVVHESPASAIDGWKVFNEAIKESFRTTGMMAALIAAAAAALLTVTENTASRALLLSSLACSVISASSAANLLPNITFADPLYAERTWHISGVKFIILLSTPSAWLSHAFWTFQIALLAIAYRQDIIIRVFIIFIISFGFIVNLTVALSIRGDDDVMGGFFGINSVTNHRAIIPLGDAIDHWQYHMERLEENAPGQPNREAQF